MDYIILDMEWNQPWPGSPSAKKPLPVQIRGEIIQIGAVRILEDQTVADEFQVLIKPRFYRRLNKRVSKLTGIQEARLKAEGIPFPEAMEQFRAWCGEDVAFLTWGFDDIAILQENLALFQLPADWTRRWYNAQMMFNAQTDGSSSQKALKTALAFFQIPPSRPAHDALGDAYHTALICARLDLKRGIQEYEAALQSHENGFHGAELPGCLTRQVYYGLAGKEEALDHMAGQPLPHLWGANDLPPLVFPAWPAVHGPGPVPGARRFPDPRPPEPRDRRHLPGQPPHLPRRLRGRPGLRQAGGKSRIHPPNPPPQTPPSCQTSYSSGESWKYVRILSANTVGMLQRKGAYQRCLICCYFCLLLPSQVSRRSP